ncbi:MAG: hypothetical protein ACREB3_01045 [Burkholderiales bacterium]
MKADEGPVEVEVEDLRFFVAVRATDGTWVVRVGFSRRPLAEAYAKGMAAAGVEAKVCWDDGEGRD